MSAGRARHLTEQIVIRMSSDLLERVRVDAQRHGRTVAQTIRFRLTEALDAHAPATTTHGRQLTIDDRTAP